MPAKLENRKRNIPLKPEKYYNSRLEDFDIQFIGLQNESYVFEYQLNQSFLRNFEYAPFNECNDCDLHVKLLFTKKNNLFILDFSFEGTVNINCDRCLVAADLPVSTSYQVFVKTVGSIPEKAERDLDIVYISGEDTSLNTSQLVYEFIVLSLPAKRIPCVVLKDKTLCDQVVLQKWQELNGTKEAKYTENKQDPRWDVLKELKDRLDNESV
ncbi:MAG: DUF177 domain-containing protein [Sphingobacteriales bacterium]|nr:MAG: DUF177 domain-containing protein [Sphingobacteriales bacterium]